MADKASDVGATVRDIWKYSQRSSGQYSNDPGQLERVLQDRRQAGEKRMNFGDLFDDGATSSRASNTGTGLEIPSNTSRTALNIQKSINLLDEAVGTPGSPGSLLRIRTPRHSRLDNSSFVARSVPSRLLYDQSPATTPARFGQSMNVQDGTGDASLYALGTPGKSFMSGAEFSLLANTSSNVNVLQEDPGFIASTGLFKDFLTCVQSRPSEHQVFDLVHDYEALCADQAKLLKKLVKMTAPGKAKFSKITHMLLELEKERWTWALVKTLYQDRVETVLRTGEEMIIDGIGRYKSDKLLVNELFEKDATTRQAQVVVDWLERIAEEGFVDYRDQVEFFQDRSGAWENTLHALRQAAQGLPVTSQRLIVTELDPDAPLRLKRPLDDLDLADERRLLQFLFALVRSGQLDEAQRLCARCGQAWRAATLEGWRLHHDPNYSSLGVGGEIRPVEGNPYRDLWRNICWKMADDDRFDKHERAIYAALSGNLRQLLRACRTWEDYVWAYSKVMVDQRVEQHLGLYTNDPRPHQPPPAAFIQTLYDHQTIFSEIESSSSDVIRSQCKEAHNVIIKYIIVNDIEELTKLMHSWVVNKTEPVSSHFKRFLTHLVLFFRIIGVDTQDELCVEIIEAYVQVLIDEKQNDLVASYVASLPQLLQVQWYALFLEGIHDKDERRACLRLAEDSNLDVAAITKCVVENIRNKKSADDVHNEQILEATTSQEDRVKIEAIDWLVFDPAQRAEAVKQANAVMRAFLAVKKLAAAREVFTKIPQDSIELIHKNWRVQAGTEDLPHEDSNAVHEFVCIQAYLDAHDSFNDWFQHFHNTKPAMPELGRGVTFTERVAQEHKMKQYNVDLERWKHSLEVQTKTTVDRIYNVLLFVEGGWMVDFYPLEPHDDNARCRQQQMAALRQLCLPALCYLLVRVQTDSGQHSQCLQLVDVLAAESHKLYQVFRKDELQKLLSMFKFSSLAVLDQGQDPLGYDFPTGGHT